MRFTWLTDIHLNFLDEGQLDRFLKRLSAKNSDAVIISGDIGEADTIHQYLSTLSAAVSPPIYFVLGNHDYYRGSIEYVRSGLIPFLKDRPKLHWLNKSEVVSLPPTTALIGHDSWADARLGDYWKSNVQLNDFVLIGEFIGQTKQERLNTMMAYGDEGARHFERVLPEAFKTHNKVIIVTHVPPFSESALYRGKVCEPDWLPLFSCKAVGDVLKTMMAKYPDKEALVLCGHTHGRAVFQALPNLKVVTGGAVYGKPTIPKEIVVE